MKENQEALVSWGCDLEKKYAFVSDYARFWILYHYGGLYFDTDVEVIKNMDDIIERGPFMGCEKDATDTSVASVAPGLGLGVCSHLSFYKEMLELYGTLNFRKVDGKLNLKTIVEYTTEILVKYGLQPNKGIQYVAEMWIYPVEYFCPIHIENNLKVMNITPKTLTIHHFAATWKPRSSELLSKVKWWIASQIGGENLEKIIVMLGLRKIKNKK